MHQLRSLALHGSDVTNDELAFVLDGCPQLEVLDLRGYEDHIYDCENLIHLVFTLVIEFFFLRGQMSGAPHPFFFLFS